MIKILLGSLLVAVIAVLYTPVSMFLTVGGALKTHSNINTATCRNVHDPLLVGCENGQLHPESGIIYYACAIHLDERDAWFPPTDHMNKSLASHGGIIAFDTKTETAVQLEFDSAAVEGFAPHGLGIYFDSTDPQAVYIHAVNHRHSGSVVEIFKHILGATTLEHIETAHNPEILYNPNDVHSVGPRSFYASNDRGSRSYFAKISETLLALKWGHVVYYHDGKWSIAAKNMAFPNGVSGSKDSVHIYVVSVGDASLSIFKRRTNGSLKLVDFVKLPAIPDNIAVDPKTEEIYIGAIGNALKWLYYVTDHTIAIPGNVLKISPNEGTDKFYGKKYSIEAMLETDGTQYSSFTSAIPDPTTHKLFLAGLYEHGLFVCNKMV
ncbi:hypothetical protein BDV3_004104 [Batrachochytrium dendrobatidis]|uniref:SMP-30/Gluconolactonase/LRE-like region domain-containing protein n=1 Tax=Batrachochytrium dendrobatidis (strain JEL423) TaxID=403673 RepID=A0A177WET5_BATDL|nr:hypothetical protein BDEG_22537 [Batrachochytrium dendrobatidis JEL423]